MKLEKMISLVTKVYFTSRVSMIFLGAPGIGKSTVIREASMKIADLLGKTWIEYDDDVASTILANPDNYFVFNDLRLTEVDPSDLIGVPRTDSDYVSYKPLLWARVLNKCAGLLLLDEYTNVEDDTVRSVSLKLLLDRKAGYVKFSEGVMVIALGNRPEESSLAREIPAPAINRCCTIHVDPPSLESWMSWMSGEQAKIRIPKWLKNYKPKRVLLPRILAYLTTCSSDFIKLGNPETLQNFPTPRTWTLLSMTLTDRYREIFDDEEILALCTGFLGEEVGSKVYRYLTMNVPTIQELLENPEKFDDLKIDEQAIFVAMLSQYLTNNIDSVKDEKVKRLLLKIKNTMEEFAILLFYAAGDKKFQLAFKVVAEIPEYKEVFKRIAELRRKFEKCYSWVKN